LERHDIDFAPKRRTIDRHVTPTSVYMGSDNLEGGSSMIAFEFEGLLED
jgi:hypothetical protein